MFCVCTGCSCVIDLRGKSPRVLTVAREWAESIRTCLIPLGPLEDDDGTSSDDEDEEEEEEEGVSEESN